MPQAAKSGNNIPPCLNLQLALFFDNGLKSRRPNQDHTSLWRKLLETSLEKRSLNVIIMSDKSNEKYSTYQLGDWELQRGEVLPGAWIAYKTFGDPKAPGGVILYPSWYSGSTFKIHLTSNSFRDIYPNRPQRALTRTSVPSPQKYQTTSGSSIPMAATFPLPKP